MGSRIAGLCYHGTWPPSRERLRARGAEPWAGALAPAGCWRIAAARATFPHMRHHTPRAAAVSALAALLPGCALFPRSGGEWTAALVIVGAVVVGGSIFALVSMRRARKDDRED